MIYAVIDTNVLVSAFITKNQDSSTAKVWSAMLNFDIIPMYSEEIIEEYKDVLHRKKFDIPRVLSDDFFPDPKDVVFYEVAMSKEEAYLVTGNTKHFPKNPIVVTPAEMLKILQREGSL